MLSLSGATQTLSLGASLAQTLFDGGKLRAQVASSQAARQQLLYGYRKSTLTALGEVEDALNAVALARQQERLQQQSSREAERTLTADAHSPAAGPGRYGDLADGTEEPRQQPRQPAAAAAGTPASGGDADQGAGRRLAAPRRSLTGAAPPCWRGGSNEQRLHAFCMHGVVFFIYDNGSQIDYYYENDAPHLFPLALLLSLPAMAEVNLVYHVDLQLQAGRSTQDMTRDILLEDDSDVARNRVRQLEYRARNANR